MKSRSNRIAKHERKREKRRKALKYAELQNKIKERRIMKARKRYLEKTRRKS